MTKHPTYETDIVIVGAGGAGLRAAIAARESGARVLVICKSLLGKAHTIMAEGGIAAALGTVDDRDNWQIHFRDSMAGGKFINDWRAVEIHAKEASNEVVQLERWGALFDRTQDGRILQRLFGGHTYARLAHVGDRTGVELLRTLQDAAVARSINVLMEHTVTRILVHDGRVAGAFGYARESGEFFTAYAPAVIIATGGVGRLYAVNSNSWEGTGDGQILAFRAGAELTDMEFIQFHPTGMVWPLSVLGILVTEAVRGEGGYLLNSEGSRFMKNYDAKRMELSTRDIIARAIYTEVREGRGSPHGGVFLTISHKSSQFIRRKLPSMYEQFMAFAGVDITREPMEVYPTTHYAMGGIRIQPETCATCVPGLFAAGEASGGLHGANRLGGNSLSDLLVFGRRAGEAAAAYVTGTVGGMLASDPSESIKREMLEPLARTTGERPGDLLDQLGALMMEQVGVFRTEEVLRDALTHLHRLRERAKQVRTPGSRRYNPGWHAALQVEGMIELAMTIAESALLRTESRGAHTRIDYPQPDKALVKGNTVIRRNEDETHSIRFVERTPLPDALALLIGGMKQ